MSIISTVPKGAAVEGINPNLLRNWYFVGGGTGRGIFPVNSRGQTSYTSSANANVFSINGWKNNFAAGSTQELLPSGLRCTFTGGNLNQTISSNLLGKQITISCLTSTGFYSGTGTLPSSIPGTTTAYITVSISASLSMRAQVSSSGPVGIAFGFGTGEIDMLAIKTELGDQQTLAHQENGTWVLNEIPDYEEEYYRCITSDVDSNDTYAQQQVSNITVQCNSVGSSSLRYYNNLIQSTHKVLDSTFSNPAAQTSDITVTTYDGYLDFSNGFASGATTNITLVLGTSGPVLSTTTTAPS